MLTGVFVLNGAHPKQSESLGSHCLVYGKYSEEERDLLSFGSSSAKIYSLMESCCNTVHRPLLYELINFFFAVQRKLQVFYKKIYMYNFHICIMKFHIHENLHVIYVHNFV